MWSLRAQRSRVVRGAGGWSASGRLAAVPLSATATAAWRSFSAAAAAPSSTTPPTATKRAPAASSAPLPPLVRRLYRQLLRVAGEFDRLPTLKAALLHPASDEVNAAAQEMDHQWRLSRHQAIQALTRREQARSDRFVDVRPPSVKRSGAVDERSVASVSAALLDELQPSPSPSSTDARPQPAHEFTRMLMEYHNKHSSEPLPADAQPDDLDLAFEQRAREKFFERAHGPSAPLSERMYWKLVDRFFRRRKVDWLISSTADHQPRITGAVHRLPQAALALIDTPPSPNTADAAATVASEAEDASAAPTAAASSSATATAAAEKTSLMFLTVSPHDPPGTFTPEHYLPTRSFVSHVRREFRSISRAPSAKQMEAITQALFRCLKYLNGEKLAPEPILRGGSSEDTTRARTWMTRLLSQSLPPTLLASDPSHVFQPVLRDPRPVPFGAIDTFTQLPIELVEPYQQLEEQWEADLDALLADDANAAALALTPSSQQTPQPTEADTPAAPALAPSSSSSSPSASSLASSSPPPPSPPSSRYSAPAAASAPLSPSVQPPQWPLRPTRHLRPGTILVSHPQIGQSDFLQSAILLTRVSEVDNLVEGVILNQPWRPPDQEEEVDEEEEADRRNDEFERKVQTRFNQMRAENEARAKRLAQAEAAASKEKAAHTVDATVAANVDAPIDVTAEVTTTPTDATATPSVLSSEVAAEAAAVSSADKDAAAVSDEDDAALWSKLSELPDTEDSVEAQRHKLASLLYRFPGSVMYGGPVHFDRNDVHQDFVVLHRRKDWAVREHGLEGDTNVDADANADGQSAGASRLPSIIPAELECTAEGVVRELTPPVFVGTESHWAQVFEWIEQEKTGSKWQAQGRALVGESPHSAGDEAAPVASSSSPSTSSATATSAVAVTDDESVLHSWDFLVFHGRVTWSMRELVSQLNAGDWFTFEGNATHVFTGLVSPQQVAERTASLQRRARGERRQRVAQKRSRFRSRVAARRNEDGLPPRGWDAVPFELMSSPAVSLRSYASVVSQLSAASPSTSSEAVSLAATAHLPAVLFPRQRLWHHAMHQLKGDARHWAYLPRIGLNGHDDDPPEQEDDEEEQFEDEDDHK